MSILKTIISTSFAASLLVPFSAVATPPHRTDPGCALAGFKVTEVAPYRVQVRTGRGTTQRLAGAKLFIPAQPGLTREWIAKTVTRHLHEMKAGTMAGCPLDLNHIQVNVASGGTGYWVQISGSDFASAKEILARAQHLVH